MSRASSGPSASAPSAGTRTSKLRGLTVSSLALPAFRARTARSAPIASLVRNPGSPFLLAKCFAGVYGTASTG